MVDGAQLDLSKWLLDTPKTLVYQISTLPPGQDCGRGVGESGCLPPINRSGVERKISFISDASNCSSSPPPQATSGARAFIYTERRLSAETAQSALTVIFSHLTNIILIAIGTVNLQFLVSQVTLVVKNLPASAGDIGDAGLIPGQEDPLEESMGTL